MKVKRAEIDAKISSGLATLVLFKECTSKIYQNNAII